MAQIEKLLREKIIAQPEFVTQDPDIMRALVDAYDQTLGDNVVDVRGVAMRGLEERISRIEDTHRTVIAAAYDNHASTSQIHRAVLRLLDCTTLTDFMTTISTDVAAILQIDTVRIILEMVANDDHPPHRDGLILADPGVVAAYLTGRPNHPQRQVTLRQMDQGPSEVYGTQGEVIRSEACLLLEFGQSHLPGLLVLGSENPQKFNAQQGTDLLVFFAHVVENCLRRLTR